MASGRPPIVLARDLRKVFRTTVQPEGGLGILKHFVHPQVREVLAVDGVSFRIERGERVGYLGPNGAGKSTTIKMLAGILVPSAGRVEVGGIVPHRDRQRHSCQIGVVFGQRSQLLFDLPVRDSFSLLRYMYQIPMPRYRENLARFAEVLEIGPLLDRSVRTLSLGQRMRCEILAALLHDPAVLFLDEPTIGLDVVAKDRIRAFIERINQEQGVTVLLTTHDLTDIERLCPRVIIIDQGKLIYDGSLKLLRERLSSERELVALLPDRASAVRLASRLADSLGSEREAVAVSVEERTLRLAFDQRRVGTLAAIRCVLAEAEPEDLMIKDEGIEGLIRRIYRQGDIAGPAAPARLQ
jgi:ABC-2 type transport system ATP-binding protein